MDWKNIFLSFEGRIGRKPFWLAIVAMIIVTWVLEFILFGIFGVSLTPDPTLAPDAQAAAMAANMGRMWPALGLLTLITLWPNLAIYAKRWHDRDKSGWWTLIILVPLIGALWALIECGFLSGTRGPNRFGPDPLDHA